MHSFSCTRGLAVAACSFIVSSLISPAFAAAGDVYVSDTPLVLKVSAAGISSPFSTGTLLPGGAAFDRSGNLFVADTTANLIVKITPTGTQSVFLSAGLSSPRGIAFDAAGNLYVADSGTNSILKVTAAGVTTTFATGLNAPRGLAFDAFGNLYVADSGSNAVIKIGKDGTKSTVVSAGLNSPYGLAFDSKGTLLVSNRGSNAIVKVSTSGVVSPFVSAGLNAPEGLGVDASGNIYVADSGSGSLLKVTAGGTVSTDISGLTSPSFVALAQSLHEFYNISTRGYVQTGDRVLIGGFIVRGDPVGDLGSMNVVVRAIGPELTGAGITDALLDPVLDLYNSDGQLVASNDNWKDTQQTEIEASGLAPSDDRESAIFASLPDGRYTAIVHGANNSLGTALIEVYKAN